VRGLPVKLRVKSDLGRCEVDKAAWKKERKELLRKSATLGLREERLAEKAKTTTKLETEVLTEDARCDGEIETLLGRLLGTVEHDPEDLPTYNSLREELSASEAEATAKMKAELAQQKAKLLRERERMMDELEKQAVQQRAKLTQAAKAKAQVPKQATPTQKASAAKKSSPAPTPSKVPAKKVSSDPAKTTKQQRKAALAKMSDEEIAAEALGMTVSEYKEKFK